MCKSTPFCRDWIKANDTDKLLLTLILFCYCTLKNTLQKYDYLIYWSWPPFSTRWKKAMKSMFGRKLTSIVKWIYYKFICEINKYPIYVFDFRLQWSRILYFTQKSFSTALKAHVSCTDFNMKWTLLKWIICFWSKMPYNV